MSLTFPPRLRNMGRSAGEWCNRLQDVGSAALRSVGQLSIVAAPLSSGRNKTLADLSDVSSTVGKFWDNQLDALKNRTVTRTRWWDDETSIRHINRIVSGEESPAVHAAFHERIRSMLGAKPDLKALSVGCGAGTKEMWLMQLIDVARFDLFDLSHENIKLGQVEADRLGVQDRVRFSTEDAFSVPLGEDYDLVYWNNALHHMPDVTAAIRWSFTRLRPGGLFAMDDFVGPDRFQWTDENLKWASEVRRNLPERFLRNPFQPDALLPFECFRPSVDDVVAVDPSEAVDSSRILPALLAQFPACEIIPTGGALYHLALNDIFCNFTSAEDLVLLKQILLLDQALAASGTTQYAVAFARKPQPSVTAGRSGFVRRLLRRPA